MASYGHHENGLRDEPVKKQAAAEYRTGKESDGVPTVHQVQANNHEIGHRFFESKSSEDTSRFFLFTIACAKLSLHMGPNRLITT